MKNLTTDSVLFLTEYRRMCKAHENCCGCPMNNKEGGCGHYMTNYPEETIKIISDWVEKNPRKTRADYLIERFPNASLSECGTPIVCAKDIFGEKFIDCTEMCYNCWHEPIIE